MNITDLSKAVADETGIDGVQAKSLANSVFNQVAEAVSRGEEVAISGFGKFTVKDLAARKGRNPATGETIDIAASKKVTFSPAKGLKERL